MIVSGQHADLLIFNGTVLTMNLDNEKIENGAVAVSGDKIAAIGKADFFSTWKIYRAVDAKGGIIMPGLVNTHTHAAMTCFRGMADDMPLMTWLHEYIFPAEACMDESRVFSGSLLACAEMILSGTTCFCDMYLFEDGTASAACMAGMRAVVGEVLYDFPSPNYGNLENGFIYTQELINKWKDNDLITIAVEPHSPYLCSPKLLQRASEMAQKYSLPLVIHVSETENEAAQIRQKYGSSPVEHLAELGVLAPNLLACHCVALSDNDISLLKQYDIKVSHNPESNMKLASGIAPVPKLIDAGICVGLGTDGCSSNNNLDLLSEMDMTAKLHKVNTLDPAIMNARTVLRMATIEGARALGMDSITGSLEPGKHADIIIVDTSSPHMTPMYNPESHLVYSARAGDIITTIINGNVVMENRQILTFDVEKAMADVNAFARTLNAVS
ncbi:5-methylthioadenosine/S-adenosylhomocysteine deaminase [Desulfonema limicola]|uniref:5-methylthioadenosine/S-adenosylhomocysteine deaminase n=1 Tax=Desulfonema limicola TaxID=45656 RepID=A0A975GGR3_9BACT|nr:amidohydrolase [Desulfonema limicola]QTA80534.1 5-methylthioadenosine/S-adenosylhomocysteine deaminase [Desulfonema limicola]